MKIVVAPDSFKGSIDASDLCNVIEKAVNTVFPEAVVTKLPLADGGEGTVDSILAALKGERREVCVHNPLGEEITASYGVFEKENAVIEMAEASGLPLIPEEKRAIMNSNTYGTGQLILDAIAGGCKTIYMGIGGSATNDGGMGCAAALGAKFTDAQGKVLEPIPANFTKIAHIDASKLQETIAGVKFVVMCDVTNPLLGEKGATNVYGRQKGANAEELVLLEQGLAHYSTIIAQELQCEVAEVPGAGAAGGLGAGLLAFTHATMNSGVETILDILSFRQHLEGASLVITGEGRMDYQSAYGKVAYGVGCLCKAAGVPTFALVGGMGEDAEAMFAHGIDSIMTTVNSIMTLDQAVEEVEALSYGATVRALRLIKAGMQMQ